MKSKKIFLLLPLLILYTSICLIMSDNSLRNDEIRYADYARNLTHGFYAPSDTLMLWNGPGYPILLMPFAKAGIGFIYPKYLNAFFLFAGICFIYLLLSEYLSDTRAVLCAYLLGAYPPFLFQLPMLLTESLSVFLIGGFAFFVVRYYKSSAGKFLVMPLFLAGI